MFRRAAVALMVLCGGLCTGAKSASNEYEDCVSMLLKEKAALERFIPVLVMQIDRRFYHMSDGIRIIEENNHILRGLVATRNDTSTHHMLNNAIEECRAYHARYRAYARGWIKLLMLLSLTLGVAAVWVGTRRLVQASISDKPRDIRRIS